MSSYGPLPVSKFERLTDSITCKCDEVSTVINQTSFNDAFMGYFDKKPIKCIKCEKAMDLDYFVNCIDNFRWGNMPMLYSMVGAQSAIMTITIEPNQTYDVSFKDILGEDQECIFVHVNGDGGYNNIYPTIDINYLNNPRPMYDGKDSFKLFTSYLPIGEREVSPGKSTLLMQLCSVNAKDDYKDKYLLDFLIESIRFYLRKQYDNCILSADQAQFARVRMCAKKTNITDIKKRMPEELNNLLKDRNNIRHHNTEPHNSDCGKMLIASILIFFFCRWLESNQDKRNK